MSLPSSSTRPEVGVSKPAYVFKAALDAGLWPLTLVGAFATVVGAGYYLWIMKVVWFDQPGPAYDRTSGAVIGVSVLATILTFPVLVFGLGSIEAWANAAANLAR